MAGTQVSAGSIQSVVTFGLELATAIHTYVEAVWEAKDRLRDVAIDINSTASTLKQLQALVDADRTQASKVFRDEGLDEVHSLAKACEKVYSLVVILLTKAGNHETKDKVLAESINPRVLKTSVLTRHMRWRWLAPRIKRCQGQLRLFKTKLFLHLQLASIASIQLGLPERQPGAFREELILRALSLKLRKKELRALKNLTAKYKVIEDTASEVSSIYSFRSRIRDLDMKDNKDSDEVVVVEESETPDVKKENETSASSSETTSQSDDTKTENTSQTSVQDEKSDADAASECGTLVDEPQNVKDLDADLKKPMAENVNGPPPPPPPMAPIVEEPKLGEPKLEEKPSADPTEESQKDDAAKSAEDEEAIDLQASSGTFSFLPSWLKNLFGKNDKRFTHDWESPTLECFIVSEEFRLLKLPFGHQRLTYGLRRTQRKIGLTWDQYMSLDSPHKKEISRAINKAKALDSRQRTCIAIGAQKKSDDDFVVLFMSLGPKVEPIKFKDAVGRQFTFPYESCKTWAGIEKVVQEAFRHVDVIGPHVMQGHYDLINSAGTIMLPSLWQSLLQPGEAITMHMWPMPPEHLRPQPPMPMGPPGWNGPPPPRPRVPPAFPPPPHNWPGRFTGPPPPPPPGQFPPPPQFGGPPGLGRPRPPIVVTNPVPPPPITRAIPRKPRTEPVSIYSWMKGKPAYRRRRAYWSDSETEDGSDLDSDSDVENEDADVEIAVDFEKEEERAKLSLGEVMSKFTTAWDTIFGEDLDSDGSDSSGNSSSSSGYLCDD